MSLENISLLLLLLVICKYFEYISKLKFQKWNLMMIMYILKDTPYIVESNLVPKYKLKVILNTVSIPIDTYLVRFDTDNGIYPKNFYRQI